jgi:hypothetical protein
VNRVQRLYIDNSRRITFIFGKISVIKVFKGNLYSHDIKLPENLAKGLYREFLKRGAQVII